MSTTKFFPPITAILPVDSLPNELGFVKTGLTNMLSHVYFRDLQCSQNDRGDSAFYSLSIVSLKRLDIEIPGTGMFLILNPSHDPLGSDFTEFPITVSYRWPILGYLRQFNLETFSFLPGDIFDLALRVVGVMPRQVVERALNLFVPSAAPIDTFVDDVNALFGTSIAHPASTSTDPLGDVLEAIDNAANINGAGGAVFALYLLDALSEDSTRDRISTFFEEFFDGGRIEDYIKQLLTPKIDATLKLSLAIEFPRTVLEPLDKVGGEPLTDQTIKTLLIFEAGSFFFCTNRGIGFDETLEAELNHPCRIAGTSFGISLKGAKLDISRTTNIPEATADGRPVDFVGVYIEEATLSFPAFWNHDEQNSTGIIKGSRLLLGTGGTSGTLALEAVSGNHASPVVKVRFGKDFSVSLDKFSITLKQNAITGSTIEGTLVIPGFKDANNKPAEIRIKVGIKPGGDFDITAHEDDGFKTIKCGEVFNLTLKSVFFGKKDDDFYLGVSGTIKFTHKALEKVDPVEIEKLVIWSDGRFEIEGGTIPLPKNIRFPIGPAELSISAIHMGSHQRIDPTTGTIRDFRYFGFDGSIDVNPGGLDVRGKGIKFFYPADLINVVDDSYLEIKSIAIDLVIPGTASKETASLLISGFLSIGGTDVDPAWEGGVSFALPKMKISGGASMQLRPKVPAFIVDAFVELSTPIPLGATSLGIYGFRGLFGHRYIASKAKVNLKDTDTWFDYYKVKDTLTQKEGLNISKFEGPSETKSYDNVFSIGAGVSLADTQNSGETFSCKLFLLLSLPDLIYLEGKANILGPRLGITGDEDPPFFAVLALSPQSVELGVGVSYKIPREGGQKGWILDLNAEMRAAFFFQNSSAWYINFGTIQNPTTARVLSIFDATAYVMLSAAGIAAGAGVTFGFDKRYAGGLVRASVGVYIKVGGTISFQSPQIGGFAMLGGHVDVSLMGFGFYLSFDTSLLVEVARPFFIQGSVHLCVSVKIGFKKFSKTISKCFDVEFKWEKNSNFPRPAVVPFTNPAEPGALSPVMATNMLSGETFNVVHLDPLPPSGNATIFDQAVLPLDTWIDIEFLKGLIPSSEVDARIGRLSGQVPANTIDLIPPAEVPHKVQHEYSIKKVEIKAWNGNAWVDYRPYEAMSPPDALAELAANPSAYKDGFWQNSGSGFNKLRLLAETSLSYMQQGQPGWYVPEQFGITSATLFCTTKLRQKKCISWIDVAPETTYADSAWGQKDTVLFRVSGGSGRVISWTSHFDIPRSLMFPNEATAEIVFNKPCAEVNLKLTTFSSGAAVRFYKRTTEGKGFVYKLVETRELSQLQLLAEVHYNNPVVPVAKVGIDPINGDPAAIYALQVQLDTLNRQLHESTVAGGERDALLGGIEGLEGQLASLKNLGCRPGGIDNDTLAGELLILERKVKECRQKLAALRVAQTRVCKEAANLRDRFVKCFPTVPSTISHEIFDELDVECRARFRFRVFDDLTNAVLFTGTQPYPNAASAESALIATLELSPHAGNYALMTQTHGHYFFQLVDTRGQFIAVSPALFNSPAQLFAFVEQTSASFRAAQRGGEFSLPRREDGKLPCDESLVHLACWGELPVMGAVSDGRCSKVVAGILSARDAFCNEYNKLYRELYGCNRKLLDQVTNRCDELTLQLEIKRKECAALADQLAALLQLQGFINTHGPLLPPEGVPCSTLLHEACCLSLDDYQFNISAPGIDAIEQDYQATVGAVQNRLAPTWRPHTKYYVRLQVTDTVDNAASGQDTDFYFGFSTVGPLGHYHDDPLAHYKEAATKPDRYMLTGLKGYIDYRRSYPNADGELIRAKPLFYEDARILLFFTKRYTYHFFGDWPAYNGLPALTGNAMQIVIKDPAGNTSIPNPPPPEVTTTEIPRAVVAWPQDNDPRIPEDIRTLLNLRNPELLNPTFLGGECWPSGGEMIKPAGVYTSMTPKFLKPLKLYTAVVNNMYQGKIKEVHQYVFQTSRYPNFLAQINSYGLDDGKGNHRDAVYPIEVSLLPADMALMFDVVSGNMSAANAALAGTWADPFDRLVEGVLKLKPLDAAVSTEFNIVRNTTTNAVVAVWIRNPESFNDPKLSVDDMKGSLGVMDGANLDDSYEVLFSKDCSQVFVMHPSRVIPVTEMKFRFAYIEWNGDKYVDRDVVVSSLIPMNI